jgi:hypothetical protein
VPEELGRGGGELAYAAVVLEELGKALVLTPLLGTTLAELAMLAADQALCGGADLLGRQQDRGGIRQAGIAAQWCGVLRFDPRQPTGEIHGVDGLRGEARPSGLVIAVNGDYDVGDGAVDDIARVEHHGPD